MPGKSKAGLHATLRSKPSSPQTVLQFLIVLLETGPLVWRRIQVPEDYTFWDLHIAIQDSMGWFDSHLHEFHVQNLKKRCLDVIGVPDKDDPDERPCITGWKKKITDYFGRPDAYDLPSALYVYDFGDDWRHIVIFEGRLPLERGAKYPRCISGERACPPEDCGGVDGYGNFLKAISDPTHPEHEELVKWSGGSYDPAKFDLSKVTFDDPLQRWKLAFQQGLGL